MKRIILIASLLVVIFLVLGLLPPIYLTQVENYTFDKYENLIYKYEVHRYPAKTIIVNYTGNLTFGISSETNILHFGKVPLVKGVEKIRKMINLYNSNEEPVKILISFSGNISKLLSSSKNNFILNSQGNSTVEIALNLNRDDIKIGTYSGEVRVLIIKPKWGFFLI